MYMFVCIYLYKYIRRTLGCTCARPLSWGRMNPRLGVHGGLVAAITHGPLSRIKNGLSLNTGILRFFSGSEIGML